MKPWRRTWWRPDIGKFSRDKGRRGELDLVHRIPGAKRVGWCGVKTMVDVSWPGGVAQVKNCNVGGSAIDNNLQLLAEEVEGQQHYVIFKPKRGTWIIAQALEQWLKTKTPG